MKIIPFLGAMCCLFSATAAAAGNQVLIERFTNRVCHGPPATSRVVTEGVCTPDANSGSILVVAPSNPAAREMCVYMSGYTRPDCMPLTSGGHPQQSLNAVVGGCQGNKYSPVSVGIQNQIVVNATIANECWTNSYDNKRCTACNRHDELRIGVCSPLNYGPGYSSYAIIETIELCVPVAYTSFSSADCSQTPNVDYAFDFNVPSGACNDGVRVTRLY